jgi:ribosome-binding factor A
LALFRHAREIAASVNRSELMRTTMELLVEVTEKVEEDLRFADAYAAAAQARTAEDEEFLDAAQRAGAALSRDE